jgi:hypothetical protein
MIERTSPSGNVDEDGDAHGTPQQPREPALNPSSTRLRLITLTCSALAVFVSSVVASPPASAAAPSNDSFVNAQALFGAAGTVSGGNVDATREAGEPLHEQLTVANPAGRTARAGDLYRRIPVQLVEGR